MNNSAQLFERAKKVIPGGVNSPVRAFNAVGGQPRFIDHAIGSHIYDVDGRDYIDYLGSWGPMILGHQNPAVLNAIAKTMSKGLSFGAATELEVTMAELITSIVKPVEMVRMVNSGTEAVMSAIRLARGYTHKHKIIKFAGCYHGHSDSMLVKAGSGVLTNGNPDCDGVTPGAAQDTLIARYNDLTSVEQLFTTNKNQIAAIIVEPVAANMGLVLPEQGFLPGLRQLCDQNNALLIFDEVITGFRLALGGAMEYFSLEADLVTYGKIIGGGMPVGAYGGRREIMELISPLGKVYQAGTLSGNPLAMAAGIATLSQLRDHPQIYATINALGQNLAAGLRQALGCTTNQIGSLVCAFCTTQPVTDDQSAQKSDTQIYGQYFRHMLEHGIYIAPAQFETMFISKAHTAQEIAATIKSAAAFPATLA